jgi:hypothetical protein
MVDSIFSIGVAVLAIAGAINPTMKDADNTVRNVDIFAIFFVFDSMSFSFVCSLTWFMY